MRVFSARLGFDLSVCRLVRARGRRVISLAFLISRRLWETMRRLPRLWHGSRWLLRSIRRSRIWLGR